MSDAAVTLSNVTKTYGQHTAVAALDLVVPRGRIYGFIGPNGSGKTTTIRMILHIILPDSGGIEVLGETGTRAANDRIGYLPEERGLYKHMTVERQLAYAARLKGVKRSDYKPRIAKWLDRLDLGKWRKEKVSALSKGMSQKIQFIAAVVAAPELLILDEPFSGLDPVNAEVLRDAIIDLRDRGTTIIFSTHDMSTAEDLCDAIFMIYKGEKVLDGSLDQIQAKYGADTVRLRVEEGERVDAEGLPHVEAMRDLGRLKELRLSQGADTRELLSALAARYTVRHFEISAPSLHDIFIRIAGKDAAEQVANPKAEGGTHG